MLKFVCLKKLLQKFVNFMPVIPVGKDSGGSLPKLVPVIKIKKGL